jgi:hypothetical protein
MESMRIQLYAGATLMLAALSLPLANAAQKFQQPTKDELQMTSDPKAPGAEAVYFFRQIEIDNYNHYVSSYARIKVLTEKGKKWATVELPYNSEIYGTPIIEGRTIHSDGTVIPLSGKVEDFLILKKYKGHEKTAVFQLPGVEVGSILEYKWILPIEYLLSISEERAHEGFVAGFGYISPVLFANLPPWDVQQKIYVHREHFYFNPYIFDTPPTHGEPPLPSGFADSDQPGNLEFNQRLPKGATIIRSLKGDYTLDVEDVPAIPNEEFAPPDINLAYYVEFYIKPQVSIDAFWKAAIGRWAYRLKDYASEGGGIKDAAMQITAGAATPEAKARKLYDAVQALENTDYTRVKIKDVRNVFRTFKKAHDIWSEKRGSSEDIAGLYLALARAAGLNVEGLQVANRDRRLFDPNLFSLLQLGDYLVVLHIDGKDIYLDPGEKLCPFGQLNWKHTLAGGIQENAKAPVYTPSNATKDAVTAHAADLTVDAQGGVTGTVKILMNGPAALHYRQLNLTSDLEEVRKQLNESLRNLLPQGITGEVNKIQGLETAEGFVSVSAKVSGLLGSSTGKRLLLPGFFFSTGAHQQFVSEEKRVAAVDLHYADQVIDDAVYHLPAGFTVESAPQPAQLSWPEHATLVVKTTPGTGSIEIKHIFARGFVLLDAKEYPALREYYQKIAANDQQQLVLVKAQGAAGN